MACYHASALTLLHHLNSSDKGPDSTISRLIATSIRARHLARPLGVDPADSATVALLHGAIELDRRCVTDATEPFPAHLIDAAAVLLRADGESFDSYCLRIVRNELARCVAIAERSNVSGPMDAQMARRLRCHHASQVAQLLHGRRPAAVTV